jgi:hypothetical protein
MLPTLNGRIQTRIFLLAVVGGLWTLALTPLLGETYAHTYTVLAAVAVLGIGWELIYHLLQQFRWEKDWPTLFGLLTGINEGLLLWFLLDAGLVPGLPAGVGLGVYCTQFATTWVLVWLVANGPMRVPFIHWRFRGGRLI